MLLLLPALILSSALCALAEPDLPHLDKRQNASFTINQPGQGSDTLSSGMPLPCVSGCFRVLGFYEGCQALGSDKEPCTWLCGSQNYTTLVQCLNCVIANGEPDVTNDDVNKILSDTNGYCSSADGFSPTSSVTASPTTTGPFTTTFTDATTNTGRHPELTFPIWTGLESLAQTDFYSQINSEIDARQSGMRPPIEGPTIGQSSSTPAPSGGQPTSSAAPSASTSGGATKLMEGSKVGGFAVALMGILLV